MGANGLESIRRDIQLPGGLVEHNSLVVYLAGAGSSDSVNHHDHYEHHQSQITYFTNRLGSR